MPRTPSSSPAPNSPFDCFAVAAPGLEPLVAGELQALGETTTIEDGGVAWRGDAGSLCRANLWLRTASRVLVRIAHFRAEAFHELERHARRIAWERFVTPGSAVRFRVTCRKSRLYHSDAVAQRMAQAIEHRLGAASRYASRDAPGEDEIADTATEQLFVVRLAHDQCTVSADSSGALLHLRGYRQAVAKAPLRETLAAALLAAAEWRGDRPLVDPLCGSGTIPIEAALLARRIPPGIARQFACLEWPGFPRAEFARLLEEARAQILPECPVRIFGSDRDAGAIEAARSNAARAGVGADVQFAQHAISAMAIPDGPPGLVASNPPYGVRVGERHEIRNLFAQLGHVTRRHYAGWQLAIFSPEAKLTAQVGFPMRTVVRTRNGGIPVQIDVGDIVGTEPAGRVYF